MAFSSRGVFACLSRLGAKNPLMARGCRNLLTSGRVHAWRWSRQFWFPGQDPKSRPADHGFLPPRAAWSWTSKHGRVKVLCSSWFPFQGPLARYGKQGTRFLVCHAGGPARNTTKVKHPFIGLDWWFGSRTPFPIQNHMVKATPKTKPRNRAPTKHGLRR